MGTTAYWSPNQASIAQVETYIFSTPSLNNTFTATINGKSVTYMATGTDTAASVATALFNLLVAAGRSGTVAELSEITFANPSAGVVTATANVAGTPFANVTIAGVSGNGLVMTTGNGLANGILTVHTTANASPSDVNDPQNWLRVTAPAPGVRQLPQNGDNVVVTNTSTPLLWNVDALASVQFGSYARWQSFTGTIGLPENNPNGYTEWRATYMKFLGPQGSVPAGGLTMVLGYNSGSGSGPTRERYNLGSQKYTCQVIAAGNPTDEYGIRLLGVHTDNSISIVGGASVGVAMLAGETSSLNSVVLDGGATIGVGPGVTWTTSVSGAASSMTTYGGSAMMNAAPATLVGASGTQFTFATDVLTWASIVVQGGCNLTWLAGGTVTTLTMTTGCTLDKSQDARALTITSSTIDGDTCSINDPLNAISYTNATTVKQQVTSGPFRFTGSRTVKVV